MSLFHSSLMTWFGFNYYGIDNKSPDFCLKINDQKFNCNKDLLSSVSITVQKFVSKSKSHGCSCKIQDIPRGSDWSIVSKLLRNEKIEINSGNFRFLHKVAKSLHISSLEQATSSFIARSRENTNHHSNSRQFMQNNYDQRYESPKTPNKTIPAFNLNLNTSINNNNYNEVGLIPQSARSVQPYQKHSSKHHHKNSPSPSVSSRHTSVASPPSRNVEFKLDVQKPSSQNRDSFVERTYDFEKGRKTRDTSQEKQKRDYDRQNKLYGNNNNNNADLHYCNNDNGYKKPQEKNDFLQRSKPKNTRNTKNNDMFEYDLDNDYNDHEVDDEEDISQRGNKKPITNKYDDNLIKKNNYDEDSASLALKNSEFQNYGLNRFDVSKKFQPKYNDNQKDEKYRFNDNNDNNMNKDRSYNNNNNNNNNNDNNKRFNSRFEYNNNNNNDNNSKYNRYPDRKENDNSDKDNNYNSYSDYEEQYAWLKNNKHYSHNSINRNHSRGKSTERDKSPTRNRKSTSTIHKSKNDGDYNRNQDRDKYGDRNNDKKREVKIDLNQSYDHFNDNGSKHQQNLNVSRDSYRSRDALSKGSGSHHDHHRRSTSPTRHGHRSHHTHHEHRDHGDHRSHHSRHEHDLEKRSRDGIDKRSRDHDRDIELDRRSNGKKESRYMPSKTTNSPNAKTTSRIVQQNPTKSSNQQNPRRRSVSPNPNQSSLQTKERSATPTVRFVINNQNKNEEEEVSEIQDDELGLENLNPDYDNIECLKTMESSFLKLNQANIQSVAIECINLIPSVSYQVVCRAICYSYAIRYNQPEIFYSLAMKIHRRLNDNKFLRVLLSILDQPPPEFVNEFGFFKSCFSDEIQFANTDDNTNYYDINSNSGSKKFKVPSSKNQVFAIIRRDDVESFKALIKSSFNYNINKLFSRSENEFRTYANQEITMIEYAAFYGSFKIFKFLREQKGIQITDKLPMFAVAGGNFDIVKLCANECFFDDCPALAAKFHRWEIFEWLIDVQQESYAKQHIFRTCLQFSNYKTLFKFIKRKGGKSEKMLTKAAEFDNLILYKYLLKLGDKEVKRLLITIKRPHGGFLPIHYAVLNQNLRFVKFLLDISTDDVNNYTTRDKFELKVDPRLLAPIHFACKGGDLLILRLLLRYGKIDINEGAKGKNLTPLHIASKHGHLNIVKYLLKRKQIRVNEQTLDKRMTALHYACAKGFTEIVLALVNKKGIDKNLKNSDGRTAAQLTHNYEILKLFK